MNAGAAHTRTRHSATRTATATTEPFNHTHRRTHALNESVVNQANVIHIDLFECLHTHDTEVYVRTAA